MGKLKKPLFRGVATALVTPFSGGAVDYISLGNLIERQITAGIDGLVICGTTGESATLSDDEHHKVLSFALEKADGRVPMIAGTGSNDTAHAVEMSKFAADLGYDGLLTVTPYYNKATPKGLADSFEKIADSVDIPIILYNVPTRTCCNIPLSVYKRLSNHENIAAVKEASGNISDIALLFAECGDKFDIYSGNDDQTLPMLALGGAGVISVVSNVIPREMVALCKAWFKGDLISCRALHEKYLPLMKAMFCEVNPIPCKTALAMLGLCCEEFRLPMCPMEDVGRMRLETLWKKYF